MSGLASIYYFDILTNARFFVLYSSCLIWTCSLQTCVSLHRSGSILQHSSFLCSVRRNPAGSCAGILQDLVQASFRILCRHPAGFCPGILQDPVEASCRILCRHPAGSCAGILQDPVQGPVQASSAEIMQDPVQTSCRILCRLPAGSCAGILQDPVQTSCRIPCRHPAGSCAGTLQGANNNSAGSGNPAGFKK